MDYILYQVEEHLHVCHDADYKNRRWLFSTYNFGISIMWSPFLAKAEILKITTVSRRQNFSFIWTNLIKIGLVCTRILTRLYFHREIGSSKVESTMKMTLYLAAITVLTAT